MTTTANKAGLRAAATARTAKAAQRTPLPPKPGKVSDAKATIAAAKAETPPDDKAQRYVPQFKERGWSVEVTRSGARQELVAIRGDETIFLSWMGQAHISGESTYTYADRTVKVRNPAEALRMADRPPAEAKESQAKVASNRSFVKRATGPSVGKLPFDPETVSDEDLAAALAGRSVQWHNRYRVESETATVGRIQRITVKRHDLGHRIVSFIDPHFGFRAFRLDNLERVGGKAKTTSKAA